MAEIINTNSNISDKILRCSDKSDVFFTDNATITEFPDDGALHWAVASDGDSTIRIRGPLKTLGLTCLAFNGARVVTVHECVASGANINTLLGQGDHQNTGNVGGYYFNIDHRMLVGYNVEITIHSAESGDTALVVSAREERGVE